MLQRLYARTANLGFRFCFTIKQTFAILSPAAFAMGAKADYTFLVLCLVRLALLILGDEGLLLVCG